MKIKIADLIFDFGTWHFARIDDAFQPFVIETEETDIRVKLRASTEVNEYHTSVSPSADVIEIQYHPEIEWHFHSIRGCFMHIPIEEVMTKHNRLILHAACITSKWGGILFSGYSGVGKSTQADLWKKYENSEIINGDRAVLTRSQEGEWNAYGSPYAGTSEIYKQASEKVNAIVLLEKGEANTITVEPRNTVFRRVFTQISIGEQNPEQIEKMCDLTETLISEVPVYFLTCRPDEEAVEVLKKAMEKGVD